MLTFTATATFLIALVQAQMVFIENSQVKVGLDLSKGAAISWVSKATSNQNLVNTWDEGRLIQQSFYGDADGSNWNGKPWTKNPVQGGCWKSKNGPKSKIVSHSKPTPSSFEATIVPLGWASCRLEWESTMTWRVELQGNGLVKVSSSMAYKGPSAQKLHDQELPAVFVDKSLANLVRYEGGSPWKNGPLTISQPGGTNQPTRVGIPEKWVAYVNPSTQQGLGIFSKSAYKITSYRVTNSGNNAADCSYVAPLATYKLQNGQTYSYDFYLKLGTPHEIRSAFSHL